MLLLVAIPLLLAPALAEAAPLLATPPLPPADTCVYFDPGPPPAIMLLPCGPSSG